MADGIKLRFDHREFDRTLRKYAMISKRTIPEIINTKAFFICRRAVVETAKASGQNIRKFIRSDSGEHIGKIINARRGAKGLPGLYGAKMAEAVATVLAARLRSVAYVKSGWLPAIKNLAPLVPKKTGAPRQDRAARQVGQEKGSAIPARPGWSVKATIVNAIGATGDRAKEHSEAIKKYGEPALKKAFDFETNSMKEYMESKFKQAAKESGIRTA